MYSYVQILTRVAILVKMFQNRTKLVIYDVVGHFSLCPASAAQTRELFLDLPIFSNTSLSIISTTLLLSSAWKR